MVCWSAVLERWVLVDVSGPAHARIFYSLVSLGEGLILKKEAGNFSILLYAQKRSYIIFYYIGSPTSRQKKVLVNSSEFRARQCDLKIHFRH